MVFPISVSIYNKGFTLIEIILGMLIMASLFLLTFPAIDGRIERNEFFVEIGKVKKKIREAQFEAVETGEVVTKTIKGQRVRFFPNNSMDFFKIRVESSQQSCIIRSNGLWINEKYNKVVKQRRENISEIDK